MNLVKGDYISQNGQKGTVDFSFNGIITVQWDNGQKGILREFHNVILIKRGLFQNLHIKTTNPDPNPIPPPKQIMDPLEARRKDREQKALASAKKMEEVRAGNYKFSPMKSGSLYQSITRNHMTYTGTTQYIEPTPEPESKPTPEQAPVPEPTPEPTPEPAQEQVPVPEPTPELVPEPKIEVVVIESSLKPNEISFQEKIVEIPLPDPIPEPIVVSEPIPESEPIVVPETIAVQEPNIEEPIKSTQIFIEL